LRILLRFQSGTFWPSGILVRQLFQKRESNNISGLRLCAYNCQSITNSLHDVRSLCATHDVVLLQEHWLLPFELGLLSNICNDFIAFGVSAVNIGDDILKGVSE